MKLRIGTRGSALAMAQAGWVAERLRAAGCEADIVIVRTTGDVVQDQALPSFGGAGVFTREIDAGQREGAFELSVHSLKDLPTAGREGLVLAAVPERAPVEDCLVSASGASLAELPRGARVGTGSPRRSAQLLSVRRDLSVHDIRGNVDTRIRKVREGAFDATLLARAGLLRLCLEHEIAEVLPVATMLPAAGQGALAIVVRSDAAGALSAARTLDDLRAHAEVDAERAVLSELGGGCHLPLGCLARCDAAGRLTLRARVVSDDGLRRVEGEETGDLDCAAETGARLGLWLVAAGARDLLPRAAL